MKRTVFLTIAFFVALSIQATSVADARDISLKSSILRVEKIDDEEIVTFLAFTAVTDDTTVTGSSGTYNRTSELFKAIGSPEDRVTAVRSGDDPFDISASHTLTIDLDSEMLRAEGDVIYVSGDTKATSQLLVVDERDFIKALISPLIEKLPIGTSRSIIMEFLDRTDETDKLVFLQDNVIIDQDDSSLRAAWVVFNEGSSDEMISVAADDHPLELIFSSQREE